MDFNFHKWEEGCEWSEHPKIQKYIDPHYCVLFSYRDSSVREEDEWRWDCWDWEGSVKLEYEIVDFWYENGTYFHILQKYNHKKFEEEDFQTLQEEIFSSTQGIAILEVNILIFFSTRKNERPRT